MFICVNLTHPQRGNVGLSHQMLPWQALPGPSGTAWLALKKNIGGKAACSFFFLFFHNLRQGHREVSNIMVRFNQKVRVGEELRRLGLSAPGDEKWKNNNKDGAFCKVILSLYHLE